MNGQVGSVACHHAQIGRIGVELDGEDAKSIKPENLILIIFLESDGPSRPKCVLQGSYFLNEDGSLVQVEDPCKGNVIQGAQGPVKVEKVTLISGGSIRTFALSVICPHIYNTNAVANGSIHEEAPRAA